STGAALRGGRDRRPERRRQRAARCLSAAAGAAAARAGGGQPRRARLAGDAPPDSGYRALSRAPPDDHDPTRVDERRDRRPLARGGRVARAARTDRPRDARRARARARRTPARARGAGAAAGAPSPGTGRALLGGTPDERRSDV